MVIFFVVVCKHLDNLQNGQIKYSNLPATKERSYSVNTKAIFSCNGGYHLIGPKSRTCQPSGNWDRKSPRCNRKHGNLLLFQHVIISSL